MEREDTPKRCDCVIGLSARCVEISGWRVKAGDRQEWSRIIEQTKTHPGL